MDLFFKTLDVPMDLFYLLTWDEESHFKSPEIEDCVANFIKTKKGWNSAQKSKSIKVIQIGSRELSSQKCAYFLVNIVL